ncbi:MAG: sensor histidine kinase [Marmoricola sp.]
MGQLLTGLLGAAIVLTLLIGGVGTLAALRSEHAVTYLTEELAPANRSNREVLADLLNAETYLRGFVIADDRHSLAEYRASVGRVPADEEPLRSFARARDRRLWDLVEEQTATWQRWVADYVRERIARGGGPAMVSRPLYRRGVRLFDAIRSVNARIGSELDSAQDQARDDAAQRLHATIALIAIMALLGAAILVVLGRWISEQIRRPLGRLEEAAARLASGDHAARAPVDGLVELRRVSSALNDYADESERARAVEARIQDQLREVDAAKSDFVSNVSHELRTPLTIISGYLELLDEELVGEIDAEQAHMLEVTRRNVQRLRELIEDLLTLDRAEHSGTAMEQMDLRTTVRNATTDLQLNAANRAIRIEVALPDGPVLTLADPAQMQRALLNLVNNAVKFSPRDAVVSVSLEVLDDAAVITVRDRGMGIPAADLPKLGSRFFRASNAVRSEVSGTGLGLRIVQTIVRNHHGTMTLDSVEGEGTSVALRMPLRPHYVDEVVEVPSGAAMEPSGLDAADTREQAGPDRG